MPKAACTLIRNLENVLAILGPSLLSLKTTLTQKDIKGRKLRGFCQILLLFHSQKKVYSFANNENPSVFVRVKWVALPNK